MAILLLFDRKEIICLVFVHFQMVFYRNSRAFKVTRLQVKFFHCGFAKATVIFQKKIRPKMDSLCPFRHHARPFFRVKAAQTPRVAP